MATTEISLSTQALDATLIPSKISTNPADNFVFPGNLSITDDKLFILGNSGDAYLSFSTNHGGLLLNADATDRTYLNSISDFRLFANTLADGSGSYIPALFLGFSGSPTHEGSAMFTVDATGKLLIGSDSSEMTGDANVSAILQANATDRGFLPPRMDTTQRNAIASPAAGLQIYNTDTNSPEVYDGTEWTAMGSAALSYGTLTAPDTVPESGTFNITGTGAIDLPDAATMIGETIVLWVNIGTQTGLTIDAPSDGILSKDGFISSIVVPEEPGPNSYRSFEFLAQGGGNGWVWLNEPLGSVVYFDDVFTAVADGTGQIFTLSNTATANSEVINHNGLVLRPTVDYTISGTTLTILENVLTGDSIQAIYAHVSTAGGGGGGSVTFPLLADDGTSSAPSYSFTSSPTTGIYLDPVDPDSGSPAIHFTIADSTDIYMDVNNRLQIGRRPYGGPGYNGGELNFWGSSTINFNSDNNNDILFNDAAGNNFGTITFNPGDDNNLHIKSRDGADTVNIHLVPANYEVQFEGDTITFASIQQQGDAGWILLGDDVSSSSAARIYINGASSPGYTVRDGSDQLDLTPTQITAATTLTIGSSSAGIIVNAPSGNTFEVQVNAAPRLTVSDTSVAIDAGLLTTGLVKFNLITISSASYTVLDTDYTVRGDATSNVINVALPAASAVSGRILNFKKIDSSSNNVNINRDGADLIDGQTSVPLTTQYQSVTIQSDGTNWNIL